MPKAIDRTSFKQQAIRKLGGGVIKINVSDDQIEDAVVSAVERFNEFHEDGNEECYYVYTFTTNDVSNGYITIPSNIYSVIEVLHMVRGSITGIPPFISTPFWNTYLGGQSCTTNALYGTNYGMRLSDYTIAKQHYELTKQMFKQELMFEFSRYKHRIVPLFNYNEGDIAAFRCDQYIDPEEFPSIYGDQWLLDYTAALIKKTWGSVLQKTNIKLADGSVLNGEIILGQADQEISALEERLKNEYTTPVMLTIG